MLETILTLLHGAAVFLLGVSMGVALAGVRPTKQNNLIFIVYFIASNGIQLLVMLIASEDKVWKLYPLLTHIPLILLLCFVYRKPLATAIAAAFTSYLCCQPSKWFGVLVLQLTNNAVAESCARIICHIPVAYIAIFYLSPYLSEIFSKDRRSVCIFGFVPTVYYVFDYVTVVYTNLWLSNERVVMEFLPFFLSVVYMGFCFLYYKEYEQKADAQRKEQIIRIAVEQQAKEITAVKQIEQELRILRHDMRMLLSSLAISIENGDTDTAREMICSQISIIDGTKLEHFCSNDIVNYVISDYAARSQSEGIAFNCSVELESLAVDEITFASILSNALDNALNAQKYLAPDKRRIKLMLKNSGDKLLLSVKNPVAKQVIFSDGLPISGESGHGYGTQSIRYLSERLGGNCQFFIQDGTFILRVVL